MLARISSPELTEWVAYYAKKRERARTAAEAAERAAMAAEAERPKPKVIPLD